MLFWNLNVGFVKIKYTFVLYFINCMQTIIKNGSMGNREKKSNRSQRELTHTTPCQIPSRHPCVRMCVCVCVSEWMHRENGIVWYKVAATQRRACTNKMKLFRVENFMKLLGWGSKGKTETSKWVVTSGSQRRRRTIVSENLTLSRWLVCKSLVTRGYLIKNFAQKVMTVTGNNGGDGKGGSRPERFEKQL